MPSSDTPYSLDDFPEPDAPRAAPAANGHYRPDGRLLPCALDAIASGLPEGARDIGAYHLAQHCAHIGMSDGEAEMNVQAFIDRCPGGDKPDAREKVRSAYKATQHPLGCEFWQANGIACGDCPVKGSKTKTVRMKRPGANGAAAEGEEEPAEDASDLALAHAWAHEAENTWLYMEGDQWFRFVGGRWRYASSEGAQAAVQTFLQRMYDAGVVKKLTATLVRNVLFLAKSLLGPHEMTELDAHSTWISLANGVYDTQADTLSPHAPEHLLTYQAGYDYVPSADCPLWRACVDTWLLTTDGATCREWVEIIQEWFGYCLIPDTSAQTAMFWIGEGGNGKGVATRILERLIGPDYCTAIPVEQLHDPYHRAELQGKLVGFVDEPDPRALQKNGNWFKSLTGEGTISARRPTEKVFSFMPKVRIVVTANDLPGTRDVSRGFFRRVLMVEWRYNVPDEKKDPELYEKLALEMPGILNWALEGLRRFRARGRRFVVPEESARLLEGYKLSEDTIGRFVKEECKREPDDHTPSKALYREYRKWSEENGTRPETDVMFGRRLTKMGFERVVKRIGTSTIRVWNGIDLCVTDSEESQTNR